MVSDLEQARSRFAAEWRRLAGAAEQLPVGGSGDGPSRLAALPGVRRLRSASWPRVVVAVGVGLGAALLLKRALGRERGG